MSLTPVGNFLAPPPPFGIDALNSLVSFCSGGGGGGPLVWLDSEHTLAAIGNDAGSQTIPLSWYYLNCRNTPITKTAQNHSFEPNENKKLAPILLDLHNLPGGNANDPNNDNTPYYDEGVAVLNAAQQYTEPSSPLFCNFLTEWKDSAILGYPTPYSNQNKQGVLPSGGAGWSFTPNGCTPTSGLMMTPNGQLYGVYSAAYFSGVGGTGPTDPAQHGSADLDTSNGTTYTIPDESMFQAMNRFVRGDFGTCQSIMNSATANWDGDGFGGAGQYRGEYLGMYLAITRIVGEVLATVPSPLDGKLYPLDTWTGDPLHPTAIWSTVEMATWNLWQISGNALPGSYHSITVASHTNQDNETNIALTYPYAYSWHKRVQKVAMSGMYNLQSRPGSIAGPNSILNNGYPTPDGSAL